MAADNALSSGVDLDLTHTFKAQDLKFFQAFLQSFKSESVLSEHRENTGGTNIMKKISTVLSFKEILWNY